MYNELKELLNEYYKCNFDKFNNFHCVVEDFNIEDIFINTGIMQAEQELAIYKLLLSLDTEERKEQLIKYYYTDYKEMRAQNEQRQRNNVY